MVPSFESGALLGHVYTLEDGPSIRLRLARSSDFAAIRDLLARAGFATPELVAGRSVHFDPRWRYVVCATGLVDSSEQLLGVGSIRLDGEEPDLLVLADSSPRGLRGLLETVLVSAARASARAA